MERKQNSERKNADDVLSPEALDPATPEAGNHLSMLQLCELGFHHS